MLRATFVRKPGQRDHVYVTRGDGTEAEWAFPTYGDSLPHDLCHLVIEDELGLHDGFWGLVDQHVEVRLVNNQATLVRGGRPLLGQPGVDFSGLQAAEAAVAALGPTSVADPPAAPEAPPSAVAAIRHRLAELGDRWRRLDDGGAITLTFPSSLP